jgi:hypothetical protein
VACTVLLTVVGCTVPEDSDPGRTVEAVARSGWSSEDAAAAQQVEFQLSGRVNKTLYIPGVYSVSSSLDWLTEDQMGPRRRCLRSTS